MCECECVRVRASVCVCVCVRGEKGAEGGCADLKLGVANGSGANKADGSTH